jgi:hypothetical protein
MRVSIIHGFKDRIDSRADRLTVLKILNAGDAAD